MNEGDKVLFWRDERPLLDASAMSAVVTGIAPDGKTADLRVENAAMKRTFNFIGCPISDVAAPGVCTPVDVTAASQHAPDERIASQAAPAAAAAPEPAPRTVPRRGSSGGSAAPAAEGA